MPSSYVALQEADQCLAFSRNNHRRCRLRRLEGQKTCNTHKNYYKRWFVNHQPWYRITWLSQRELAEWKFQLSNGYVDIPESYVRSLNGSLSEYYRFLVQYAQVPVDWNRPCLTASIVIDPQHPEQTTDALRIFLNTPEDCAIVFKELLFRWIQTLIAYHQKNSIWLPYADALRILQTIITGCEDWQQLLFSQSIENELARRARIFHVAGSMLAHINITYVLPLQQDLPLAFKTFFKDAAKRRIAPFHEELIAAAWHPDRVSKWLEAGIEPCDM